MSTSSTSFSAESRLTALRAQFKTFGIGMYVVLTQDEHNSEYTSPADNRREFISEFTGSAGTVVISQDQAVLATDGRYFLQAEKQLDSKHWSLLKQGTPGVPTWQQWVAQQVLKTGVSVGIDPTLISYAEYDSLVSALQKNELNPKSSLVAIPQNLVDVVWGNNKPARKESQVKLHPLQYTGKAFQKKLADLRVEIEQRRGQGFVVTALDEIAWLYNLRGSDVPFNPVFRAFSYITADKAVLYIDSDKISKEVLEYLAEGNVDIKPYEAIFEDAAQAKSELLAGNAAVANLEERRKILVSNSTSWALFDALGQSQCVSVVDCSPVELAKSVKNPTELKGSYTAHVKDGVALIKYFAWLEKEVQDGITLSDYAAGVKAEEFRSKMEGYQGLSFETISSSGPNAAVIHYAPAPDSEFMVDINQIYLCDSGAQYLDGTTDTTRTLHFGVPTDEEISAYTNVLKGHVALAQVVFPEGVNGYTLDVLARQYLWQQGLDYRHGTGHGVGSFLNVHEGPIGIGTRLNYTANALEVGNVISNEPGYYQDGSFGIRIENLVTVKEVATPHNFGGKQYLGFDTITRVPFCRKLIDVSLLTEREIAWIDQYHLKVREETISYFAGDELSKSWLMRETNKLI